MGTRALGGLRVLVTRPAAQADRLVRAIETAGAQALRFPLLDILPPHDPAAAQAALARLPGSALAIITSVNVLAGLRAWLDAHGGWPAGVACAAIGGASARAARAAGITVDCTPGGAARSEDLLAEPLLAAGNVAGRRVVILRGEGGRTLLADELARRGAEVVVAELYRRDLPVDADAARLDGWLRARALDIVTVTSNESLTNLFDLLDARGRESLLSTPLLVVSPRGARLARDLGWKSVPVIAAGADAAAIVAALTDWQPARTTNTEPLAITARDPSREPPEDPT